MAEDPSTEQENEQGTPENPRPASKLDIGAEVRVSALNTLPQVRAELGRLYREARKREGRFPDALTSDRLASVLGRISTMIELAEHERAIQDIKRQIAELKGQPTPWHHAPYPEDGSSRTSRPS